ncbi:MAG: hypothetical protein WD738_17685 [Pirellulales bacterium]
MRLIVGIAFLLLGVGLLSCHVDGPAAHEVAKPSLSGGVGTGGPLGELGIRRQALAWVRTVDGWERSGSWYVSEVRPPTLHPLVVAAGQGLVSVLGLVACKQGDLRLKIEDCSGGDASEGS